MPNSNPLALPPLSYRVGSEGDFKLSSFFKLLKDRNGVTQLITFTDNNGRIARAAIFIEGSSPVGKELIEQIVNAHDAANPDTPAFNKQENEEAGLPGGTTAEEAGFDVVTQKEIQAHCRRIKHSCEYGLCYFDVALKKVYWISSKNDRNDKYTDPDAIEKGFMSASGVEDVQILLEEAPDNYQSMQQMWPA